MVCYCLNTWAGINTQGRQEHIGNQRCRLRRLAGAAGANLSPAPTPSFATDFPFYCKTFHFPSTSIPFTALLLQYLLSPLCFCAVRKTPQRQCCCCLQSLHRASFPPTNKTFVAMQQITLAQICELTPTTEHVSIISETVAPHRDDPLAAAHRANLPRSPSLSASEDSGSFSPDLTMPIQVES